MSEKNARESTGVSPASAAQSPAFASGSAAGGVSGSASASTAKLRSCVICRSRKVRCDKQSPCSNCRRAGIACVVPSNNDRPPRWARRLERVGNNNASGSSAQGVADNSEGAGALATMDRLRGLEGLVKELREQLEKANAAVASAAQSQTHSSPGGSSYGHAARSPSEQGHEPTTGEGASAEGLQKQFGRLVVQNRSQKVFVGTGFWSRISDELEGLRRDTRGPSTADEDTSNDDDDDFSERSPPSTHESERAPSERVGFLFGHNLTSGGGDLQQFRPLPSQIPFLLDVFADNINLILGIVHMPTVTQMLREKRRTIDMSQLSPANEALMFAILYAAVTSMEEEDVVANFGSASAGKRELNLKFRLGLEHALARADFLARPNLALVQALTIFLALLRRHDDPRFVWMLAGLAIRMGQSIGLHRDGARFPGLSPFEVEMRRRLWWALIMIDIRAAEDQASEYTIPNGSFDTRLPLNVADADISSETKETPTERHALTEMSLPLVSYETAILVRQMMAPRGPGERPPTIDEQARLLDGFDEKLERNYLRHATASGNIVYWVGVVTHRLVNAKMRLLIHLPALLVVAPAAPAPASPVNDGDGASSGIRDRLLAAALEVAEHNHALNAEVEARHWRWVFQTYTHWYAIVFLLIEASGRRPWSPVVERAWVALHSPWLFPATRFGRGDGDTSKGNAHVWLPLRKLMAKVRRHREAELKRLAACDEAELARVETSTDGRVPVPATAGPLGPAEAEQLFRRHWRSLVSGAAGPGETGSRPGDGPSSTASVAETPCMPGQGSYGAVSTAGYVASSQQVPSLDQTGTYSAYPTLDMPVGNETSSTQGPLSWPWPDEGALGGTAALDGSMDLDLDLDLDMDWNMWLESAASLETSR